MDKFSLSNLAQLSDMQKVEFNKALALGLASMLDEMKSDSELKTSLIDEYIASTGQCSSSATIVEDLYSKISSGIQAGSGNQNLFLGILAKYSEAWGIINRS